MKHLVILAGAMLACVNAHAIRETGGIAHFVVSCANDKGADSSIFQILPPDASGVLVGRYSEPGSGTDWIEMSCEETAKQKFVCKEQRPGEGQYYIEVNAAGKRPMASVARLDIIGRPQVMLKLGCSTDVLP